MGMYAVDTADAADLGEFSSAARNGRSAAAERRRLLSQGKQALNGAGNGAVATNGASAPPAAENRHANGAGAPPVASNGHGPSNGTQEVPEGTAVASNGVAAASNGVDAAHFGRAVSKERRRQLSQGKQALNGGGDRSAAESRRAYRPEARPAASKDQAASNGTQEAPRPTAAASNGVDAAHFGLAVSKERRRQLSQGKQAPKDAGAYNRPAE